MHRAPTLTRVGVPVSWDFGLSMELEQHQKGVWGSRGPGLAAVLEPVVPVVFACCCCEMLFSYKRNTEWGTRFETSVR